MILLQAAYYSVQMLRTVFDVFSGYLWGKMFGTLDERKWLSRIIYLETVAGVPGEQCTWVYIRKHALSLSVEIVRGEEEEIICPPFIKYGPPWSFNPPPPPPPQTHTHTPTHTHTHTHSLH